MDAVGSGRTQLYDGREYDYVFDVDIKDGVPPLKLPYNASGVKIFPLLLLRNITHAWTTKTIREPLLRRPTLLAGERPPLGLHRPDRAVHRDEHAGCNAGLKRRAIRSVYW